MENRTRRLKPIKCVHYYSFLSLVSSKLFSLVIPYLFAAGCCHIRIHYVTRLELQVIQGSNGQGNTKCLPSNNTWLCHTFWGLCHVATGNKSSFAPELLHLYVIDQMAVDLFVANRCTVSILHNIKGNSNVFHLLWNWETKDSQGGCRIRCKEWRH